VTRALAYGAAILLVSCSGSNPAPVAALPSAFPVRSTPSAAAPPAQPAATVAPSASAPAAPGSLPLAVSQGDIGASGPAELLAASSSGAWVALCQGEPRSAALVLGSGSGEAISDLYAQDATGRHVIVRSPQGTVVLIDAVSAARVDLSALGVDARRARSDYAAHRSFSFSADGLRLAYLRKQGTQSSLVLRLLADGSERIFAVGAGEVFKLRLSADARFVSLDVLREDTTKNGKLDWPTPEEPAIKAVCPTSPLPKLRSFAYQGRGDSLSRAVLSLADGALREVPDLVTPLGGALLVRESDGSLRLDEAGKRSVLAPSSCAGRVLHADSDRGLALVACMIPKKTGKRNVWLLGAGYAKDLKSELYETSIDREAVTGVRLVPLYPGSDSALVDLERRELLPLTPGSRVLSVAGDSALLWRGSDLYRYDVRTKAESRVAQGVLKNPDLLQVSGATLLSPFVILHDGSPALRSPTERPLALSATGHVLAGSHAPGASGTTPATEAIQGPLHWLDARVAAPDGPPR
jgi:hypothetical protein